MRPRFRAAVTAAASLTLALALAACGDPPAEQPGDGDSSMIPPGQMPDDTVVSVTVSDGGTEESFSLRCGDAANWSGGEPGERDAGEACAALEQAKERLVELSDPDREPEMCTEIYGGPETATIDGRVDGAEISVRIDRTNGCGISDWERLQPLLGEPSGVSEPVS